MNKPLKNVHANMGLADYPQVSDIVNTGVTHHVLARKRPADFTLHRHAGLRTCSLSSPHTRLLELDSKAKEQILSRTHGASEEALFALSDFQ
jgi:hypothetical protein